MEAAISGIARKAVIIDGDSVKCLDLAGTPKFVDCKPSDIPYVFGDGLDLRFIGNTNVESITKELKSDSEFSLALDLALISLDRELEEDIRSDAVRDLDELIRDESIIMRLEGVMYARPLPEDADLQMVLSTCKALGLEFTTAFFGTLSHRQSIISDVSTAWDVIPTTIFGGDDQKMDFQRVAVQHGLFRLLVIAVSADRMSDFLIKAGLDAAVQRLRNARQVLQQWAEPFRAPRTMETNLREFEDERERTRVVKRRHGRRIGIDRPAVLREVSGRKANISAAIRGRDLPMVRSLVEDLISFQRQTGETKHLAKSLCDLAMEAKDLGMFSLQLELTEKSIGEAPDDGWSWAQHGDALLNMQKLDEALRAYEQADSFGAGVFAKTGRAEVLKARGELPAALAAYEDAIRLHPENAVARNGRAEVLKTQGEFPSALAAYEEVIRLHPENAVAKNGQADVLKAQGELPAALAAYEEVIRLHPEDVFAKTGRAEVLKVQGELSAALAAYEEVIRLHPENVVAKNGQAEVLKATGELPAALAAYEEVIRLHPEDVVAKNGRAEVLKATGELPAALAAYEEVIRLHPENVVAKSGRAEVLKATGELPAALAAYEEVIRLHPEDVVAKNGRAEVLKATGELPAALAAYEEVIRLHPENVVAKTGRAEVLKAQGELPAALAAYDKLVYERPEDRVARTGRVAILAAMGRYQEALASLPERKPRTLNDWIDYHILGMIHLRTGKMAEAVRIFTQGIDNNPWASTREHFLGALALTWLRGHDFKKAADALDQIESAILQPAANVFRIHAFGAQGNIQRATLAYEDLRKSPQLRSCDVTQELHHQFILRKAPRKDESWLAHKETEVLLLAA